MALGQGIRDHGVGMRGLWVEVDRAVEALVLRVIADRLEHGEAVPQTRRLKAPTFLAMVALLLTPLARAKEPETTIQLQATVEKAMYCGSAEDEIATLQIRLRLRYLNVGKGPVMLSR